MPFDPYDDGVPEVPFGRYYDGVPEFVFDHYDGGVPDVKGGLQTLFLLFIRCGVSP